MVIKGCCWEGECESSSSNTICVILNVRFRLAKDCHYSTMPNLIRRVTCFWCGSVFESRCLYFYDITLFVGVFSIETRVMFWFVFGLNICIGEVCRRVLDACVNIDIFGVS